MQKQRLISNAVRRGVFTLLIVLLCTLAFGTIVERTTSNAIASITVYHSWWFTLLWGLIVVGITWLIIIYYKRLQLEHLLLYASFLFILTGAILTRFQEKKGFFTCHVGERAIGYHTYSNNQYLVFPFQLKVNSLDISYYPLSNAPSDYQAILEADGITKLVSLNNILRYKGYRFYLHNMASNKSYATFIVNYDPYGTLFVYSGFVLFVIAGLSYMLNRKSRFRHYLQRSKYLLPLLLVPLLLPTKAVAQNNNANYFPVIAIQHQGRVIPLSVYAQLFSSEIKNDSKNNEQFLLSWIQNFHYMKNQPCIRIKSRSLQNALQCGKTVSLTALFPAPQQYLLQPFLERYDQGEINATTQEAVKANERVKLIFGLHQGNLKLFPITLKTGEIKWYAPSDGIAPNEMAPKDSAFIKDFIPALIAQRDNPTNTQKLLGALYSFQQQTKEVKLYANKLKAENVYHAFPYPLLLFIVLVITTALYFVFYNHPKTHIVGWVILFLNWFFLSVFIAVRGYFLGRLPLSNGYETMVAIAWFMMLIGLITTIKRNKFLIPLAMPASGFCLLVAHLAVKSPQITPLMPVLNSPILSIHVSILMVAYALLTLCTTISIYALCIRGENKKAKLCELSNLERCMLFPALWLLGIGIGIGAVWANISWGSYWQWDPKEVWALISLISYGLLLSGIFPARKNSERNFHIVILSLFIVLLITYFGVNTLIGGLHAYA